MSAPLDPIAEARRQWRHHGWHEAADGMAAVTSIVRCQQLLVARVDRALAPFGLTLARFEVLRLLSFGRAGELPMGKVGARLQVHPASVTSAVDRLERDGLVRRRRHPADGRAVLVAITARGRDVVEPATEALNRAVFTDLGLSRADLATLVALLGSVRAHAGDPSGGTTPRPEPDN